jgi:hypothetical protein
MSKKPEENTHPKTIELIDVEHAQKHGSHMYEAGIMTGAIVAANVTSNKPSTLRNFIFDVGVGALVGVGAIIVGRVFDSLLKSKPEPIKGDVIHATLVENTSPSEHSR